MTTQQLALFNIQPKTNAKRLTRAEANSIREIANVAFITAKKDWFRQRSREMGGYTARTRDQIDMECIDVAREAARNVYLAAGYSPCPGEMPVWYPEENVWMPEPCDRLASPGYAYCPNCQPGGNNNR